MCVLQAWLDFLQSFGLQEQQIADILRSSPELFYSSNIFQVRAWQLSFSSSHQATCNAGASQDNNKQSHTTNFNCILRCSS